MERKTWILILIVIVILVIVVVIWYFSQNNKNLFPTLTNAAVTLPNSIDLSMTTIEPVDALVYSYYINYPSNALETSGSSTEVLQQPTTSPTLNINTTSMITENSNITVEVQGMSGSKKSKKAVFNFSADSTLVCPHCDDPQSYCGSDTGFQCHQCPEGTRIPGPGEIGCINLTDQTEADMNQNNNGNGGGPVVSPF